MSNFDREMIAPYFANCQMAFAFRLDDWNSVMAHVKTLSLWVCCAQKPQAKYRPYSS